MDLTVSSNSVGLVAVGCLAGIISSAAQSVGLTLQRKSHILEDEASADGSRRPAHRQMLWRVGLVLFLLSNVLGSSVQITTLPLIVLSPLQAIGLVFNSICASVILREPFTRYSFIGTCMVSLGALIIATFGVVPGPNLSLDQLISLLCRLPFLTWMAFTLVICALAIYFIYNVVDEQQQYFYKPLWMTSHQSLIKGALYGLLAGILSGHSLLMAKSAVELLVNGFSNRWKDLLRWQTWLIVGLFLSFALSQLYFLNNGLRLCSTSVLYPLVFCVYNVTVIMNSLIYFDQMSSLSGGQILMVITGTCCVLLGVLSLSWRGDEKYDMEESIAHSRFTNVGEISDSPRLSHHHTGSRNSFLSPVDENTPLISRYQSSTDSADMHYTSFSFNSGIPEPAASYSPKSKPGNPPGRNLSVEQSNVLQQLRKASGGSNSL